jgi:hypothetical protein
MFANWTLRFCFQFPPWLSWLSPQRSYLRNRLTSGRIATVHLAPTWIGLARAVRLLRLTFKNFYDLESGFDGGVLEIAIGSGGFQDIITTGGTFLARGYNGTISANANSPIVNRQAWTGQSKGYVTTTVAMPSAAASQNIKLRWRLATDDSIAATGWSIDSVSLYGLNASHRQNEFAVRLRAIDARAWLSRRRTL